MAYIRTSLHLRLDESQEVLLIHTTGMMHVGIDLSYIIEIPGLQMSTLGNRYDSLLYIPMRDSLHNYQLDRCLGKKPNR